MSGRCKACNVILDEFEMTRKWPDSNDYCELCTHCLKAGEDDYDIDFDSDEPFDDDYDYFELEDL